MNDYEYLNKFIDELVKDHGFTPQSNTIEKLIKIAIAHKRWCTVIDILKEHRCCVMDVCTCCRSLRKKIEESLP